MAFNIKVDSSCWKNKSKEVMKQVDFAMITALTDTAIDLAQIEKQTAMQTLDRPTPFTLNAFRFSKATKARPQSSVFISPISSKYLYFSIMGGSSNTTKPVPSKVAENQYGNLPKGATKKPRIYHVNSNGRRYTFLRLGSGKTSRSRLIATWSDQRAYKKIFPFQERARTRVPIYFKRVFGVHLRRAFATARGY